MIQPDPAPPPAVVAKADALEEQYRAAAERLQHTARRSLVAAQALEQHVKKIDGDRPDQTIKKLSRSGIIPG